MRLKRPLIGSLLAILILAVVTISAQAAGINLSQLLLVDPYSIYIPIVEKSEPQPTVSPPGGGLVIDHNSIALYSSIPAQYLRAAERLKFTFMDRSVGANINDGLTCLSASTWASSAANCRRDYINSSFSESKTFTLNDTVIPAVISFPGGNNRSNIHFVYHEATWEEDLAYFIALYPSYLSQDIFTMQHNYLHVAEGSNIADVYFDRNYSGTNIYDLVALEARYPSKTFVYWTTSLARTVGSAEAESFNDQMRTWASQNGKILLDVADIESHAPNGSACRNSQGYEILCQNYTTETDGGHLGSVSGGKLQIAKAIWVMLAQIAGWQP
jgi:hypothetical protein